jgi:RNA polymerase sigma-70 factor, ECF subfamily
MRAMTSVQIGCLSENTAFLVHHDGGEFDLIYRTYFDLVHRICLRMLRDPAEAEDATQDVFVRVFCKMHTFRGKCALSSWLYRVTTNLVFMRFRKAKRDRAWLNDTDSGLYGELCSQLTNSNGLVSRLDLQSAVDMLPRGYKTVFILHDVHGYEHKEIAEICRYSVGNSKSQLYKARKRLRTLLGDDHLGNSHQVSMARISHLPQ